MSIPGDTLEHLEEMRNLLESHAIGKRQRADDRRYLHIRSELLGDPEVAKRLPELLRNATSLTQVWEVLKPKTLDERRKMVNAQFDPAIHYFREQRGLSEVPKPGGLSSVEAFCSMVTAVLMMRGQARPVAVLTAGNIVFVDTNDNLGLGWCVRINLPSKYYSQMDEKNREQVEKEITAAAREISHNICLEDEWIQSTRILLSVEPRDNWREHAKEWLRGGKGVNNQGRVRSANLASREVDGLLFRSHPEVLLYQALKASGVAFAPLPVFVRGGDTYQRIEPDFVVVSKNAVMVVEVDGDTVHLETPAEADQRTRIFKYEGVFIERVKASECDSSAKATACADRLLAAFEHWRSHR